MFRSHSELCRTKLDRRFVEDGELLKCGPPPTDKNEPLQINEDAKELWLKFKFVQFAPKWVEARRLMKRRRMNEACGMQQVGAGRILQSKQNEEQQSPQKVVRVAPSLITMPSVVRNLLNKPCSFTIYIPT
jgi:hypothetical protein